jgi:hypothetical protein
VTVCTSLIPSTEFIHVPYPTARIKTFLRSLQQTHKITKIIQNLTFSQRWLWVLSSADIQPCSPLKVNRRFGGTYYLCLQSRRLSQAKNRHEGSRNAVFFIGLFLDRDDEGDMFLRDVDWLSTDCMALYSRCKNSSNKIKFSRQFLVYTPILNLMKIGSAVSEMIYRQGESSTLLK